MKDTPFSPAILIDGSKCYFDGVDLRYLAHEFGTPLYMMSETIIRERCQELRSAFLCRYPGTRAYYASKALQTLDVLKIIKEEGLGVDVVSGGELHAALNAGVPSSDIIFHGNAKTDEELHYAINSKVGLIAVDNIEEIFRIEEEADRLSRDQRVILRVSPGVDSHTHRFISTGSLDSKFGLPIEHSEVERYVKALALCPHVEFSGLHFHVGSQLLENTSHLAALEIVLNFAAKLSKEFGLQVKEINFGGGFGIRYLPSDRAPALLDFIDPMMSMVKEWSRKENLPMPVCAIEPGRWIVGEAGITLYKVIAVKEIPGVRTYVSVDGGMGDNIRPALYDARYHVETVSQACAMVPCEKEKEENSSKEEVLRERDAEKALSMDSNREPILRKVTIAGRYCESGDIIAEDVFLPDPKPLDILAVYSTGAYCFSMSSNYNRVPRPAMVITKSGDYRLSVRRETYDDLLRREI